MGLDASTLNPINPKPETLNPKTLKLETPTPLNPQYDSTLVQGSGCEQRLTGLGFGCRTALGILKPGSGR